MSNTITPTVFYRKLNVEELEIFYREAGPRDAPTVLLLHAFPSSSHMFIENGRRNRVRHPNSPSVIRRGRWAIPESSRMNADDRLSLNPLGWVEGGDVIV